MGFTKKIFILILTAALIFMFGAAVFAETQTGAAKINANGVRLRAENNTESNVLASLDLNAAVVILETAGDWYKVAHDGCTGYVFGEFVVADALAKIPEIVEEIAPLSFSDAMPAFINGENVNLRSENNTTSAIIMTMKKNASIDVLEPAGEWYKVIIDGQTGYVLGKYVSFANVPVAAPASEPGVINDHGVNLRAENSTSSDVLTKMSKGTRLTVFDKSGDWYSVKVGDWVGYVLGEFITFSESLETINDIGMINAEGVNLRALNNTSSEVLTTLSLHAPLTVLDKADDWYKVKSGEKTGYVSGSYVTLGEAPRVNASPAVAAAPAAPNNLVFIGSGKAELVDWSEGRNIMTPGVRAIVTDVATNISFEIKVLANGNHADVEPLTASDTASILQIRGSYSWTPRAIRVTVGGRTIAASCNGMPHDVSTISDNNFPGHFCIHFYNSRNHYNGAIDAGQQKQVQIAYNN